MSNILDIINVPIGYLFKWLYMLVNDYGLAILLIAVITKILMLPLTIKQQKGTLSQLKFKPRITEIQTKYKDNPERMRREMAKLQEEGYSPTAGCSTMLIQFPILIGIYNVIRHPLKYILGVTVDETMLNTLRGMDSSIFTDKITLKSTDLEIKALSYIQQHIDSFKDIIAADKLNLIEKFNLNFLGMGNMNLSETPPIWKNIIGILPLPAFTTWLVVIPVVSGLTALALSLISQKVGPQAYMQDESTQQANGAMKFLIFLTPYMSYAIAMRVPAGLGLYWIASNILSILQLFLINKIMSPEKYIEEAKREEELRKAKRKKVQQRIAEERRNGVVVDKEDIPSNTHKTEAVVDKEDIPSDAER